MHKKMFKNMLQHDGIIHCICISALSVIKCTNALTTMYIFRFLGYQSRSVFSYETNAWYCVESPPPSCMSKAIVTTLPPPPPPLKTSINYQTLFFAWDNSLLINSIVKNKTPLIVTAPVGECSEFVDDLQPFTRILDPWKAI